MIDDRVLELINKDIDGTILPAEREMLDQYRARNPEIDVVADELQQMVSDLEGVPSVESPSSLRGRVMQALQPVEQSKPVAISFAAPLREFLAKFGRLQLAYALTGGAVLGALAVALLMKTDNVTAVPQEDVAGSVIAGLPAGTRLEQGAVMQISAPGVQGTVQTQYAQSLTLLNVKISAIDRLRARFSYDPASLGVRAYQRGTDANGGMSVEGSILEVLSLGNDSYTVYFDRKAPKPTPIRITLYLADTQVFDKSIPVESSR